MTVAPAILAGLAAHFFGLFVTYRRRLQVATGRDLGYKIPTMQLEEFHECFQIRPGDAPAKSEVTFPAGSHSMPAGTTDREPWILCMLAKGSETVFEFGTASGKTVYLLARNAIRTANVITLTLPPDKLDLYHHEGGDSSRARKVALAESRQQIFVYRGAEVEPRITQLFGDSKALDTAPYRSRCDLVFRGRGARVLVCDERQRQGVGDGRAARRCALA